MICAFMVGCKGPLWMKSKMAEAVSMVQGQPTMYCLSVPLFQQGRVSLCGLL